MFLLSRFRVAKSTALYPLSTLNDSRPTDEDEESEIEAKPLSVPHIFAILSEMKEVSNGFIRRIEISK